MKNFLKISDNISCCGQPNEQELESLKNNFEVVINLGLSDRDYSIKNEAEILGSLCIFYFHIPVLFDCPTEENLKQFFSLMDKYKDKKVLVHCAANYRASVFTTLYLFHSNQITKKQMEQLVLDVWQPDDTWQSFMEEQIKQ